MNYLLDTNVLLNYPEILEKQDMTIYISEYTINELDNLKSSANYERAFEARRASHYILSNYDNINFISIDQTRNKLTHIIGRNVDELLLDTAKAFDLILLTGDKNLHIKAKINNVQSAYYSKDIGTYRGVQYYEVTLDENGYNEELDKMLNEGILPEGLILHNNEFLIVTDDDDNTLCSFVNNNGNLQIVKRCFIRNRFIRSIAPRNREQECLFNLLCNEDISIVFAQGTYGSGKSFSMINYALQQLDSGKIDRIVYVANNAFTKDSREIGALPGDLLAKELLFMGTLVDIIGEMKVEEMVCNGTLELAPVATIRGRNFDNAIVFVNEAQNLTDDQVKLIIGRVGQNSRVFFDGDIKQVDNSVFKNKNGLRLLTKLKDSEKFSKIFGTVRLNKVERSFTAQAADYLDEI